MIYGFEPIVEGEPKLLILGSMPSIVSLEKQEYYGYAHNRFWKIMAHYFKHTFTSYEDKKKTLIKHRIALWDVISCCEREGSLDSAIHEEQCNDIAAFIKQNPTITHVLCNGKKAYTLYQKHFAYLKVDCLVLPSTSNANRTISEKTLYLKWCDVLDEILKES